MTLAPLITFGIDSNSEFSKDKQVYTRTMFFAPACYLIKVFTKLDFCHVHS